MVCDKCQKKLGTVVVADKWKDGATNTMGAWCTVPCRAVRVFFSAASSPGVACASPDWAESGGRKLNENKLLSSKKNRCASKRTLAAPRRRPGRSPLPRRAARFQPYGQINECKICKTKVHQAHAHYCQGCAYKIGPGRHTASELPAPCSPPCRALPCRHLRHVRQASAGHNHAQAEHHVIAT